MLSQLLPTVHSSSFCSSRELFLALAFTLVRPFLASNIVQVMYPRVLTSLAYILHGITLPYTLDMKVWQGGLVEFRLPNSLP